MMINSFFDDWKTVFSHWNLNTTKQHFEFSLNSNGGYQLTIGEDKRYVDGLDRTCGVFVFNPFATRRLP